MATEVGSIIAEGHSRKIECAICGVHCEPVTIAHHPRADGSQYLSSGFSPTGRNIIISDCQVIAPAASPLMDYARTPGAAVGICVWIRAYESIQISNLLISEGQLDVASDYWMADDLANDLGLMRIDVTP